MVEAPAILEGAISELPLPSVGSFGHPRFCNQACKYYYKPRGCKDADSCTRCHLCPWRRQQGSRHFRTKANDLALACDVVHVVEATPTDITQQSTLQPSTVPQEPENDQKTTEAADVTKKLDLLDAATDLSLRLTAIEKVDEQRQTPQAQMMSEIRGRHELSVGTRPGLPLSDEVCIQVPATKLLPSCKSDPDPAPPPRLPLFLRPSQTRRPHQEQATVVQLHVDEKLVDLPATVRDEARSHTSTEVWWQCPLPPPPILENCREVDPGKEPLEGMPSRCKKKTLSMRCSARMQL